MAGTGNIRMKFSTLLAAYPKHNALPPLVQEDLDRLNKGIPEGEPKNTSLLPSSESCAECHGSKNSSPQLPPR
jgi:hypothetical protein